MRRLIRADNKVALISNAWPHVMRRSGADQTPIRPRGGLVFCQAQISAGRSLQFKEARALTSTAFSR